jgi:hypothetical protein
VRYSFSNFIHGSNAFRNSQGAQLVHNAAAKLSSANTARIAAGKSTPLSFMNSKIDGVISCCLRRPIQQ